MPHKLIGASVDVWTNGTEISIYHNNELIIKYTISNERNGHTTTSDHIPANHLAYKDQNYEKILNQAKSIGTYTTNIVEMIYNKSSHDTIGIKKCLGFLNLCKKYDKITIENISERTWKSDFKNINYLVIYYKNQLKDIPELSNQDIIKNPNLRGINSFSKEGVVL